VIKGWDQGLLEYVLHRVNNSMCVGEKRKLVIPPQLAYGDRAMGAIKKGSTLGTPPLTTNQVFDVELIEIVGVPLLKKQEL
jgi:FK506-binding protein 2